jgi:hypothetical protein
VRLRTCALPSKQDLDEAIAAALAALAAEIGTGRPEPNGRGGFRVRDSGRSFEMLGSPSMNEIEWWLTDEAWGEDPIRSELFKDAWGEEAPGNQFNQENFRLVAARVADDGKRALLSFREDRQGTLRALEAAEAGAVERDRMADLRRQGEQAWLRKDYATVRRIYAGLDPNLTRVERKRLDIAVRDG